MVHRPLSIRRRDYKKGYNQEVTETSKRLKSKIVLVLAQQAMDTIRVHETKIFTKCSTRTCTAVVSNRDKTDNYPIRLDLMYILSKH